MVACGICLWLCSSLCGIPTADAVTVWSDNFSDGDYNGWTVHLGGFSASGTQLESTGANTNHISRASTVAVGTWSFDWHMEVDLSSGGGDVYFLASDLNPAINYMPRSGYSIVAGLGGFVLRRWENGGSNSMDLYSVVNPTGTFSFDITRDADGHIYVYIDGELVMDRQNVLYNTSTHFFFAPFGSGEWLDNIVVSNTVDITPPSTDPTTTPSDGTPPPAGIPGFPMVAIAIGLVVAILLGILVRRKTTKE